MIKSVNSKTGVYWGIHYFHIFALKHRSWVIVRTASACSMYPRSMFWAKSIIFFHLKFTIFTAMKNRSIFQRHDSIKNETRWHWDTIYPPLCVNGTFNTHSKAANSIVTGWIWPKLELIQGSRKVRIACKYKWSDQEQPAWVDPEGES